MKSVLIIFLVLISGLVMPQSMSEIKSTISFIYVKDSLGNRIPNGTCFFVGINSIQDSLKSYPYLDNS